MSRRELLERYIHQNGEEEMESNDKPRKMSIDVASDHEEEEVAADKEEMVSRENKAEDQRRLMEEQRRIIEEQRRMVEEQRRRLVEEQRRQLLEEEEEERRMLLEEHRRRLIRQEREEEVEDEEEEEGDARVENEDNEMVEDEPRVRRDPTHPHIDLNMMRANAHLKQMIDQNRRYGSTCAEDPVNLSPRHTNGSIHDSDHEPYLTHRAAHGGSPDLPHSYLKASHPLINGIKKEDGLGKMEMDVGLKDDLKDDLKVGGSMEDRDGEKPQTEWSFEEQFKQVGRQISEVMYLAFSAKILINQFCTKSVQMNLYRLDSD